MKDDFNIRRDTKVRIFLPLPEFGGGRKGPRAVMDLAQASDAEFQDIKDKVAGLFSDPGLTRCDAADRDAWRVELDGKIIGFKEKEPFSATAPFPALLKALDQANIDHVERLREKPVSLDSIGKLTASLFGPPKI
ncbi:MAG: hypothetical protein GC185_07240 [Alphaproteobacteria bacterium]|nr:hypothetical protein [Alphaproteobacteria bacterium]